MKDEVQKFGVLEKNNFYLTSINRNLIFCLFKIRDGSFLKFGIRLWLIGVLFRRLIPLASTFYKFLGKIFFLRPCSNTSFRVFVLLYDAQLLIY